MLDGLSFDLWMLVGAKSNFAVIVLGSILCLSPLLGLSWYHDFLIYEAEDYLSCSNSHTAAYLFIVTVPAIDFLFDLLSFFLFDRNSDEKSLKRCFSTNTIIRFNDIERLCFILGIAAQSTDWLLPHNTDLPIRCTVINCTENLSMLLVLTPIITYLQRCTTTFSKGNTFLQICAISLGMSLISISHFYRSDKNKCNTIKLTGVSFTLIFGLVHVALILVCCCRYCREKLGTSEKRTTCMLWLLSHFQKTTTDNKRDAPGIRDRIVERDKELYTNYIPAIHMLSSFILTTGAGLVAYRNINDRVNAHDPKMYINIAVEVLVLVVELRIRKNEIARGLVRRDSSSVNNVPFLYCSRN